MCDVSGTRFMDQYTWRSVTDGSRYTGCPRCANLTWQPRRTSDIHTRANLTRSVSNLSIAFHHNQLLTNHESPHYPPASAPCNLRRSADDERIILFIHSSLGFLSHGIRDLYLLDRSWSPIHDSASTVVRLYRHPTGSSDRDKLSTFVCESGKQHGW